MKLKVGDAAPDFSAEDQGGKKHALNDYRGKRLLLYFYPKDNTPGCTIQACGIRDAAREFDAAGIIVLGVSTDSVKSHAKFAEKFTLPFPLLADAEKTIVSAYGVWGKKKFMGREYMGTMRTSFLIGTDGKIAAILENVKPATHARDVLAAAK